MKDRTERQETRRSTRSARRARDALAVEWIAIPAAIAIVLAIGFGLWFLLA